MKRSENIFLSVGDVTLTPHMGPMHLTFNYFLAKKFYYELRYGITFFYRDQ